MEKPDSADQINRRATQWVARLDATDSADSLRAELERWLAADPRHRGAYLRAQAGWQLLDRAAALSVGTTDGAQPAARWSRRGLLVSGAAAAVSLCGLMVGAVFWSDSTEKIATRVGEIRRVPLRDGSVLAVNTATELSVRLKRRQRHIELVRGEAWFEVAKDAQRPFVVATDSVRIQAVGTAFAVNKVAGGAEVLVTEGVVVVWSERVDSPPQQLSAGQRIFVGNQTGPAKPVQAQAEIQRALAWRAGELIFNGETLAQAAAQFNRYNTVQLSISDPQLAQEKLVGRFNTNELDAFVQAITKILSVHAQQNGEQIVLTRT